MSSQVAPASGFGALRTKWWWWVGGVVGLLLVYLIAGRIAEMIARWPATVNEAVAPSHCGQFVALAKQAYGENWKVRLDPRDTTCDGEVRAAWERQLLPREVAPFEPLAPLAPQPAPPAAVTRVSSPETVCLNMISLAKAKHGDNWRAHVDPACGVGASQ